MADSPHIMVVDDDLLIRLLLSKALTAKGYAVTTAANGIEALENLSKAPFETIVSDMEMPEMDGLTLLAEIKQQAPDLPVIVLSGVDQLDVVIEAMKRGAADYIIKDQNAQTTVVLAVEKTCEKYSMAVQNRRLTEQLQERNNALEALNEENKVLLRRLNQWNEELEKRVAEATDEIRLRLTETNALSRVASAISSLMELKPLLTLIMNTSKDVMDADASSLMLIDDETQELYFHVATGDKVKAVKEIRLKIGKGIAGWVAQTGKPICIDDAYHDPRFNPEADKHSGFKTKSVLCVPLIIQEKIRGVLQVINTVDKPIFQESDLNKLISFSNHAAIAIENARLYEETKLQAEALRSSLEQQRWLQLQRDKLGKYVPKTVIEEIQRDREQALAATTRSLDCTILFSDIEGFTRISESAEPGLLVRMLNQYHNEMNEAVEAHEGILDKFIGDGIMVEFLPADDEEDHALRAVQCAIEMQQRIVPLNAAWRESGLGNLNVRIGINSGEVISGSIGALTRMDYTVVGDNVNVASRLESNGIPGAVLISESVCRRVSHKVELEKLDPIHVKNREQPVQAYAIRIPADKTG